MKSQADASESYPEELKAFVDNYEPSKKARGKLRMDYAPLRRGSRGYTAFQPPTIIGWKLL